MNSRERVIQTLNYKEPDRVAVCDWWWPSTVDRWETEGLPQNMSPDIYFDYDMVTFLPDMSLQYPYEVIEETEEYIIEKTNYGEVIKNFKNRSTTPQIIDTPIKNRSDWDKVKDNLKVNETRALSANTALNFNETISLKDGLNLFKKYFDRGSFVLYGALVGFDLLQRYIGTERLLMAIIDDPEWIREMCIKNAEFVVEMFEYVSKKGYHFDGVFLYDDLGYRNASLISPGHYKELIFDSDKLMCGHFHRKGLKVFLHSCGCVKELIPYFIEAGIDCLQPLEVKAGMDLIELKKKYGDSIAFMGGIDTRLYSLDNPALIENEIRAKFEIAKKSGGYIYHCDHSIPHDVSFSQYKRVMELVEKYGEY